MAEEGGEERSSVRKLEGRRERIAGSIDFGNVEHRRSGADGGRDGERVQLSFESDEEDGRGREGRSGSCWVCCRISFNLLLG